MISTTRVVAKVRYIALYQCEVCGVRKPGSTTTATLEAETIPELTLQLWDSTLSPDRMPVGWASYAGKRGSTFYKCNQCMS